VKNQSCLAWGVEAWQRRRTAIFILLCRCLGVGGVEFLWPCAARLAESEMPVPCVELVKDDSGWILCGGLPLSGLFVRSV
jgi:hypothetical protein